MKAKLISYSQAPETDESALDLVAYCARVSNPDNQNNKDEYLYLLARDLSHNGREFHDKVKEIILKKIKNG